MTSGEAQTFPIDACFVADSMICREFRTSRARTSRPMKHRLRVPKGKAPTAPTSWSG
jgi:hypothetical protein